MGTDWGLGWNIEYNVLSDSKSVCLVSGECNPSGSSGIAQVGNHHIANNTISRCGEAGIAGSRGLVASVIEGNLIQDINLAQQFGGWEVGAIHNAIDVVIEGDVIRQVHSGTGVGWVNGIWLDWQSQGSRITGNVIYQVDQPLFQFEADHGRTLVDNNVLAGDVRDISEWSIFERRDDHLISTLRRYVTALGGELEVVDVFDNKRIALKGI